ncbi:hypothetical protein PRIPAC_80486, partial [Pristionchus pacificus]|uniref:Uncharacterized protein n=1 Tax=Pristionchus pacificus TaxID=54126 RepID=A0A2A6C1V2_PRIPA
MHRAFMLSVLALTIFVLHPLVSYVLLFKSKSMSAEMRTGYLILQLCQFLQDIFFCLLYQPYPLTPLPVFGCMGLLCRVEWLPPLKLLGMFGIFLNGSIVIYLSILLRIQQAVIIGPSLVKLSPKSQLVVVLTISLYAVWVCAAFLCFTYEPPDGIEIAQKLNVSWIGKYSTMVVFGRGIGDTGTLQSGFTKLAVQDIVTYSIMAFLIFHIVCGLKTHAKFESAQKRFCRTAQALLTELLVGGCLYIFPSLILIIFHLRPPLFIPDVMFFISRILFMACFTAQTIASSLIFLSYHQYGWPTFYPIERVSYLVQPGQELKTQTCLDSFFKGLGFALPKDTAPAFIDYMKKLSTLVEQYGDDGIDIYCDYEGTLENCLGNLINTPCVNAESFSLMYFDLGTVDSIEYAINIPSGAYECKNKDLFKQYRVCYKDTDVNHVEEFLQCSIQLQKDEVDVVGGDRCGPLANYSNCVTNIYVKNCGAGVKSYSCNLEEIKLGVDASACKGKLPDCSLHYDVGTTCIHTVYHHNLRKSSPEMGVYPCFLFTFVSFDIAYASAQFILYPALGIMNGVFFMTSTTTDTKWSITMFSVIRAFYFYSSFISFIVTPHLLYFFRSFFGVPILICSIIAEMLIWGTGFMEYQFLHSYSDTSDIAIAVFIQRFPHLSANECIIADYWTSTGELRWIPLAVSISFAIFFTIELSIIILITWIILNIFRIKIISPKLFIIPCWVIYLPPNILMFLPLTRIQIDIGPFFFSYGFTLFPLIVGLYLERCSNTFQFVVHLSFIYLPPNITMFLLLTRIHIDIHPFFFTYGFTLFPVIDALIIMIGIRDYRYGKQPFVFTLQKFQGEFSKDIFVSFEQH